METVKKNNFKPMTDEDRVLINQRRQNAAQILGVPLRYALALQKAVSGAASAKSAIKSKCTECVGYEEVESSIRNCKVVRCPLLAYRPYK